MTQSTHDNIYSQDEGDVKDFTFDERVVAVFPDMIERSVPGYRSVLSYMGVWVARYAQPNSHCYDLGSSLGASTWAIRQHLTAENSAIIAVDNSSAMIERCTQLLALQPEGAPVTLLCQNIQDTIIENASSPTSIMTLNELMDIVS